MYGTSVNFNLCGILFSTLFIGGSAGFKIYDFHDICTDTIYDEAGELRFDAQKLSSYKFGHQCSVSVQLQSDSLPKPLQVSFYFTQFDLSETCEYLNVTVQEGSEIKKTVEGLPAYLCGYNKTLEDRSNIFTTSVDVFTVTFQRKSIARHSRGIFNLKFIAFYSGQCEGSGVSNCTNGHCVAEEYICSKDIKACGDDDENKQACDLLDAITDLVEKIGDVIQKYSWVIPVLISLCILNCMWKKYKHSRRSSDSCFECGCVSELCEGLCSLINTNRQSPSAHRNSLHLQNVQDSSSLQPLRARDDAERINTLDQLDQLSSSEFDNLNVTSASGARINSHAPIPPGAPPPSYDEVITSSYAKVSAPSYEELNPVLA